VVWVEVEGVLFKFWSGNTFKRLAAKWGELLDVDDQEESPCKTREPKPYRYQRNSVGWSLCACGFLKTELAGTIHVKFPPEAYHKYSPLPLLNRILLQSDELKQFARASGGPKVVTVQKKMANETDMGFSDHVISLENKFQEVHDTDFVSPFGVGLTLLSQESPDSVSPGLLRASDRRSESTSSSDSSNYISSFVSSRGSSARLIFWIF
nr:nucleotide-binding alpha-beta plait domain-containing protein [Tanacetum cinerariifolium]